MKVILCEEDPDRRLAIETAIRGAGLDLLSTDNVDDAMSMATELTKGMVIVGTESKVLDATELALFCANLQNVIVVGLTSEVEHIAPKEFFDHMKSYGISSQIIKELANFKDQEDPLIRHQTLEGLLELSDGEPDLLLELLDIFFDRAPTLMAAIQLHAQNTDFDKLEKDAHALKGSCGNIGAMSMMRVCEKIEALGRERSSESLIPLITEMKSLFEQVKAELETSWRSRFVS